MAKKGGSSSTVDPVATAQAQAAANKDAVTESARVNQVNQVSPFGTQTWTGDIGSPNRTVTTALTPTGQQQLDYQNQIGTGLLKLGTDPLLSQVGNAVSSPLDFSDAPKIDAMGDTQGDLAKVRDSYYQQGVNLLQPQFDRAKSQLATQLANQGIPMNSDAEKGALDRLDRSQAEQLNNLALGATQAGGAEQSRLASLEQGLRQQGINETLTQRSQPINELAALIQGAPAIGLPNFGQPAQYQIPSPDIIGATALSANQANANANRSSDLLGNIIGAGGMLGAGYLMCSRDWKEDLGPADSYLDGVKKIAINLWRYKATPWDKSVHIGPNAEQFKQLFQIGDGKSIGIIDAIGVIFSAMKEIIARIERLELARAI